MLSHWRASVRIPPFKAINRLLPPLLVVQTLQNYVLSAQVKKWVLYCVTQLYLTHSNLCIFLKAVIANTAIVILHLISRL